MSEDKEMESQEKTEEKESWGTQQIDEAKKRAQSLEFDHSGAPMSADDALAILNKSTILKCPSGVRYGLSKVSAKAMAMMFRELGTDATKFGQNSVAMLGKIEDYIPVIYEHIVSPKVPVEKIPGSDLSHILTYMVYEISGIGETAKDDEDQSFRE